MLEDRAYMRQPNYRSGWSGVTWLLASLVVVFVAQSFFEFYGNGALFLDRYLFLSAEGIRRGYVWQLFTFQFFHLNYLHLFFNGLFIYFVGRQVEEDFGTRGFWKLYLLSGVAGGLAHVGLGEAFPRFFGGPVLGASAGASGLLALFALLHPDLEFYLMFLPIPIRAITLLWIDLGISVLGVLAPGNGVANDAHLGGFLFALGYVYWVVRENPPPWEFLVPRRRRSVDEDLRSYVRPERLKPDKAGRSEPSGKEFISREVDPILDKISAHGIHSLTEGERRILESARNRMAKK
jgi:membrane associated rhomboid family serine protease